MLLHLVHDSRFLDMAYDVFEEVFPKQNRYIMIGSQKRLRYIERTPCRFISLTNLLLNPFCVSEVASKCKLILVHYLDTYKQQFIARLNKKDRKIVWIGWGGDYYDLIGKKIVFPMTEKFIREIDYRGTMMKKFPVKMAIRKAAKRILFRKVDKLALINDRIDFFSPVIYEDFLLLRESNVDFSPIFLEWNYGTLEDHLVKNKNLKVEGENILVGNSATFENNHLDIFFILKDVDLGSKKIIVPLSYGNGEYAKRVMEVGRYYFGNRFVPIVDLLPIEEYQKILKGCSVFIFNHLRQQALGNIIMVLYMGGRVFLNGDNPLSSFFKRIGITYSLIDLILDSKTLDVSLSQEDVLKNREILERYWGREAAIEKTRKLILTALGEKMWD